jgi:DNA-binding LacI/PurR family transcriptional regulator
VRRSGTDPVTLRDVAERSGVVDPTVARVLNGRAPGLAIREDTRTRILGSAAKLVLDQTSWPARRIVANLSRT